MAFLHTREQFSTYSKFINTATNPHERRSEKKTRKNMVFRGIYAGICHGLWRLVPDCSGSYSTRDRNTRCEILTRSMIIFKAANPKIVGFILSKYGNSRVNFYTDRTIWKFNLEFIIYTISKRLQPSAVTKESVASGTDRLDFAEVVCFHKYV